MRKFAIVLMFLWVAASAFTHAPSRTGIYKTWQDFRDGKLTLADKVNPEDVFPSDKLEITVNGKKTTCSKDTIFGYRDKSGNDFRFVKPYTDAYQIVENKTIVIYITLHPTHTSKGLTVPMVPTYYFSKSLDGAIVPLSIQNLKSAFSDNERFQHLLDISFGNSIPVYDYDNTNKMYTVNYLLIKSLSK